MFTNNKNINVQRCLLKIYHNTPYNIGNKTRIILYFKIKNLNQVVVITGKYLLNYYSP